LDFENFKPSDDINFKYLFSGGVYIGNDVEIFPNGNVDMFFCDSPKEKLTIGYYRPYKIFKIDYILSSLIYMSDIKSTKQRIEFINEVKQSDIIVVVEPLAEDYVKKLRMNTVYRNKSGNMVFPAAFALIRFKHLNRMEIISFASDFKLEYGGCYYKPIDVLNCNLEKLKKKKRFNIVGKKGFSKTLIY
jgi:hypothetical protein